MNIGIIILCRYQSTRLPGKILREIHGKPVLSYIVERIRTVVPQGQIVIATSDESSDEPIVAFCAQEGLTVFRGPLENVAVRFLECARHHGFDYAVRINGDNVLVDPDMLAAMLQIASRNESDFISNVKGRTFPSGMSIEMVRTSFFAELIAKLDTPRYREHVTLYLYEHPGEGRQEFVLNTRWPAAAGLTLALDEPADLALLTHILGRLGSTHVTAGLRAICELADEYRPRSPWAGRCGPLLIAEIGGNHEGDFEYAQKLADLAIATGVDYVKFQLYQGDTLVSRLESPDRSAHFDQFKLTREQHLALACQCRLGGVGYMASVWDPDFIEWIDPHLALYKIGSGDLTAYPMLAHIAAIGKPIIMSTGLSTLEEVEDAVRVLQSVNAMYQRPDRLALLQCTSMYPIPSEDANLAVMQTLRQSTGLAVGYSNHCEGGLALRVAAAMGAQVLEFHFTDSREGKTFRDHKLSLTPAEVRDLKNDLLQIRALQGDGVKRPLPSEVQADHVVTFRRAVYAARDLPAGTRLHAEDLVCLRPNQGIDARDFDRLLGKTLTEDVKVYQRLDWRLLS